MLNVNRLREFLLELKNAISAVKSTAMVVDDSELVTILKDFDSDDNQLLIAVLPSFKVEGTEDRTKWNNMLMFMVLEKSTDKDFRDNDEYFAMFSRTQATAQEIVTYILAEKSGDNGELCGLLNELKESSITVNPVWRKAQCNGWQIEIDLLTAV